ncbi:hypothetical protein NEIELOOT_02446, partial [Neisseria elongata subsp. glycolytica ATCC 29315]
LPSTFKGWENQSIVRAGRQDVFWTTNFPSVVSTKRGYNISWFKAATATVSKIHGPALVKQVTSEAFQILKHPQADINYLKKHSVYNIGEQKQISDPGFT